MGSTLFTHGGVTIRLHRNDLPDGLDPWPLGLAARSAWGRTPPHLNPHSPSPSLEGLQRPPQA